MVDHILDDYHAPLYRELDLLVLLAHKLVDVHGAEHPDVLPELAAIVQDLADELRLHMSKEENVLFPWIKSGQGRTAQGPIRVMLMEHEDAGAQLERLHALTNGFTPPPHACVTWVALYVRLEDFDRELREHIHLENHVLFPRALRE